MGAWAYLVDELEEEVREHFVPSLRDNSDVVYEAVRAVMPQHYSDFLQLTSDNMDIYNFETESGYKTPEGIIVEAIESLLSEEGYRILGELEREREYCSNCSNGYLPDSSDAEDNSLYCGWECELESEGLNCSICGNKYLESESDADEPEKFCDADCEHEYNERELTD